MNKFKKLKKALALVLVFCMVMGSIPATAFASTEKPIDAAVIFTDLHTNKSNYKDSEIKGIFGALKNSGLPFSSITSGGDAFSVNEDSSGSNGPYTGYIKNINTSIKNALEKQDIPINYVWSDHDRYAVKEDGSTLLDKTSHLSYGAGKDGVYGTSDDGNYYVYSLSMGDICSYDRYKAGFSSNREKNGFTATIDKAIAGFEADVEKLDKTKPLLIVSHQPLYDNRNDNAFAEQWFDAINKVAEDMDVAFFYGHNHKYDKAEDYYYAKGSTMPVATKNGWSSYEVGVGYKPSCDLKSVNKTLNFTHMCAGYMEPTSTGSYDNNTTRKGTVMSVSVYKDRVEYNTYSKDGKYTGNYAVNTSVPRTHAPVEEPETPIVPEDTKITVGRANVVVSGATVNTSSEVSADDQALIDEKNYEDVIGLDIDASIVNEKATLKFTVPNDWADKTDRIVGISSENGELKEIEGEYDNGFYTFEVEHFSAKGIAVVAETPTIKSATLSSDKGAVERGKTAITGSKLSVRYSNDETETVALTVGMLSGDFNTNANGVYTGLTVTYNGYTVTEAFALEVVDVAGNNYPEYPDEGAVKVNKTATGIDFQSSGLAQVEVSASGIPIEKGVDVIVMVDTSSSMDRHIDCGEKSCKNSNCSKVTRHTELIKALNALKSEFQMKNENNEYQDIRVSFADFNGFFGQRGNTTFEGKTLINSPYDYDSADYTDTAFGADGNVHVISGNTISYDAFMTPDELSNVDFTEFVTDSGTNYDYALDVIYQLGHAAKVHNKAAGEERDLKVIFMTDGAANQFNYYGAVGGSSGSSKKWDNWLLGSWKATDLTKSNLNCTDHKYYYDLVDHDGDGFINEHRMANAIKGSTDPNKTYEIIRKSTAGLEDILPEKHTNNLYNVPGLGAEMYAIAFAPANDGDIDEASMIHSVSQIASDKTNNTKYFYEVEASAGLDEVFSHIASEIRYAATNARFVDKMGDDFNLKLGDHTYLKPGSTSEKNTVKPKIEIISYDVYTQADAEEGKIPSDKNIGDRKGTFKILETVTFNTTGTQAYSDKIGNGTTNILGTNGVINANTFMFNTTASGVAIDGVKIPTGTGLETTNVLPAETFYWKMGTVQSKELAMRYYVYLEGSMEGEKKAGSYPTNKYAILYYDNYLGNAAQKPTSSPVMPWIDANVSYAFYLVDKNGNPIVNQTTGQTGSFANKVTVAGPKVYDSILMNSTEKTMTAKEVAIAGLPDEYKLYDATYDSNGVLVDSVEYGITIHSNSTGAWRIDSPKNTQTTYVTNYDTSNPTAYSNALEMNSTDHDYTHTTVWFAVTVGVEANPDTVVVDYGLPVDISVLENDRFVKKGTLAGVGPVENANLGDFNPNTDTAMAEGFATEYNGTNYGTVTANLGNGKVRYTPSDMKMNGYDKFAYAVKYSAYINSGYYYDTVTVIPATTIYYEDDFVDFEVYEKNVVNEKEVWNKSENKFWSQISEENVNNNVTQAEDRPGTRNSALNAIYDADNVYGYDEAYLNCSKYSLGSAKCINVNKNTRGEASFEFYGTGFDIVGLTSNTTGTLIVQVTDENDQVVKSSIVDTYYGYALDGYIEITYKYDATNKVWEEETAIVEEKGESEKEPEKPTDGQTYTVYKENWKVVDSNNPNALYQIPVMKISDLDYGKYKAKLIAGYNEFFDHKADSKDENGKDKYDSYELYIDAVRIYDPANDGIVRDAEDKVVDTTVNDAYLADKEAYPVYTELRDELITKNTFGKLGNSEVITGLVFVDGAYEKGASNTPSVADYESKGPNNEVYLQKDEAIAFDLNATAATGTSVEQIHLGIKSVGGEGIVEVYGIDKENSEEVTCLKDKQINTATDMYYDITKLNGKTVVIRSSGDAIISITNIKTTYTDKQPQNTERLKLASVSHASVNPVLKSLCEDPEIKTVSTNKSTYTVKDSVKSTVKTNNIAEYVVVNGEKISDFDVDGNSKVWTYTEKANNIGKMTLNVVAYNGLNETSNEVSKKVTVKQFVPKTFKLALGKSKVVVGDAVKATVTTSSDVSYVKVNGTKVTNYTTNKSKSTRTWTLNVKASSEGKMTVKTVAYNKNGSESKAVSKNVTVNKFAPKAFKVTSNSTVKKGNKYTVSVSTSSDVSYVKVNGKKITKFTSNKAKTVRTFKVTYTAKTVGKATAKVVAYNKNGYASKAKTKTVTVKKK